MDLSLNNLKTFIKIADKGSFSAAARHMGKAQSAVSTAIANLEIDLGVELFNRRGKRPVLTEEGRVLLREARQIANSCHFFLERARAFQRGINSCLRIAVDEIISQQILRDLLEKFGETFPDTKLEVLYGVLGGYRHSGAQRYANKLVSHIPFIPVMASDPPLAKIKQLTLHHFQSHRQIVITIRRIEREHEAIIPENQVWMIESTCAVIDLTPRGSGRSFLPPLDISREIETRNLAKLSLFLNIVKPLAPGYLIWSQQHQLGQSEKHF